MCFAILLVDTIAFYWLYDITQVFFSSVVKSLLYFAFWFFTLGLITAIILLKSRLDHIDPKRKQLYISYLYGLGVSSFVPKLIFVLVISILHFTHSILSEQESQILVPLAGVFSGFLPFFIILHGIFRTLYNFKINRITLKLDELPCVFHGLRLVHISDLHLGSFNFQYPILEKAIDQINRLKPDFIFFTGDLVNNYAWELEGWDAVLGKLQAVIASYAVLGNHDYGDYSDWESEEAKKDNFEAIKNFYKKVGIKLLLNESAVFELQKEKLSIVGVENWGNPPFKQYGNLQKALTGVEERSFKILLSHDPTHWKEEVLGKTNISLTLSGHTHGMQAGIRIKNRLWSPIQYKYEHWAGLYRSHNQYLYVNKGLGWLGFPGRMGMRPEITFIELENGKV